MSGEGVEDELEFGSTSSQAADTVEAIALSDNSGWSL
jgi:hypothetical protein